MRKIIENVRSFFLLDSSLFGSGSLVGIRSYYVTSDHTHTNSDLSSKSVPELILKPLTDPCLSQEMTYKYHDLTDSRLYGSSAGLPPSAPHEAAMRPSRRSSKTVCCRRLPLLRFHCHCQRVEGHLESTQHLLHSR